jgi:hypothetical protein
MLINIIILCFPGFIQYIRIPLLIPKMRVKKKENIDIVINRLNRKINAAYFILTALKANKHGLT